MKIVYIASYAPRKCGIATFTGNKFIGMNCKSGSNANEGIVVAMNDPNNEYDYPEEVKFVIQQDNAPDYIKAASFINETKADVCIVEHEFGIFGGRDGSYLLSLLHRLKMPVIAVLHTVLKNPSHHQKDVTKEIAAIASQTVVMNKKAVEFLTHVYGISDKKISVIDHGIPDFDFDQQEMKKELGFEDKKMTLTFGLIGRNKGIETAIKALPPLVEKHPDVVYVVLGKTHPNIVKEVGEEYRDSLKALAADLGIEKNVMFVDEFTNEQLLSKYLSAADVYVTPYLNEAQITSGTLSYAVGAGCAVVSTPYWHATELLTEDKGRLFNFNDHESLSKIFLDLFDDEQLLQSLRANARAYGREVTWPRIGEKYLVLAKRMMTEYKDRSAVRQGRFDPEILPVFSLEHIRRMTDDTGLLQHAKFGIPNFKEGYCLDDNARGLLMAAMAYKEEKHLHAMELLPVYLSYIHYMQNDDGTFRNFLSYSRQFLDEKGSEDSFGRTIWALGYLIKHPTTQMHYYSAREIFLNAAPNFEKLEHIRAIANTIIGVSYYMKTNTDDNDMRRILKTLSYRMVNQYRKESAAGWHWFENMLTYDNAILPLALLHAGDVLSDKAITDTAIESMEFLSSVVLKTGYLSVIGNEKWFAKDGHQSLFAQQPIDAMMMVLMFQKALQLTGDEQYAKNLQTSYMWFLGENDLRMHLYDRDTKGCFDGLESYGVNRNQGAESSLAYLISYLTVKESCVAEEVFAAPADQMTIKLPGVSGIAV